MKSSNLANAPDESALDRDDLPFQHYSLRHRVVAWISRRLFDRVTYTVRHGLIRGRKRRGGLGWIPSGTETAEERFWRNLDLTGLVVYDVGAFHGILTMFFAARCAHVVAYEPNEVNHARLIENLRLNHLTNVQVRQLGVGTQAGSGTLHYDPAMTGGGTLLPNQAGPVSQPIEITTIDRDIARASLPPPGLIKIDIEGLELEALQGARALLADHHPNLFLEMHGETMREKRRKAAEIVAFLNEAGYGDILHVESGAAITPENSAHAAEGHLYCRYTAIRRAACPTNTSFNPATDRSG